MCKVFECCLTAVLLLPLTAIAADVAALRSAVVRITSASPEGLRRTGTGFIVKLEADAVFIVTANHVVAGDKHPQVEFFTRAEAPLRAEVKHNDAQFDVALLIVRGRENLPPGLLPLRLDATASLAVGQDVTTIGFPPALPWAVIKSGVASQVGALFAITGGAIDEGNSGGPVLKDGAVVAMVKSVERNSALVMPTQVLLLVLQGWRVDLSAGPPREGTPPATAESGRIKITQANCEKLRSGTSFRVTINGEAQGPAGTTLRVALAVDDKVQSKPPLSCKAWEHCRRQPTDPEDTRWSTSIIVIKPAPNMAIVSLESDAGAAAAQPHTVESVELACRNW